MREFFVFGFEQVQAKSIIKECNFIANAKSLRKVASSSVSQTTQESVSRMSFDVLFCSHNNHLNLRI